MTTHELSQTESYTTELIRTSLGTGQERETKTYRIEGSANGLEIKGELKLFYNDDFEYAGYSWNGTEIDDDQLQVLLDLFW
jgi:hypothetical protein